MNKYFNFFFIVLVLYACNNNTIQDKQLTTTSEIKKNECNIDYSLIDSVKYYNHLGIISYLNEGKKINGKFYTMFLFELDSNSTKNEFNLSNKVLYKLLKTHKYLIKIDRRVGVQYDHLITQLKSFKCNDYNKKEIYKLIKNNVIADSNFIEIKNEILLQYKI